MFAEALALLLQFQLLPDAQVGGGDCCVGS
jgi:hypothetical protein